MTGVVDPRVEAEERARHALVRAAFLRCRELRGGEREAALEGLDARVRREVGELLAADAREHDALADEHIDGRDPLAPWIATAAQAEEPMPERVAGFRVLRRLGAGGMGVVFEAEQEAPRRRVALKLVRPGLAHGERLKRFRLEAEALGRLQHPGIAQIFDFGTCDLGHGEQPFFVMELVEGRPLLARAAEARLDRRARLALVAELCDAVQHAHERGVVHRDLKPDNVLVDGAGRAKVLDFGVARVRSDAVPLTTIHTAQGQLVGTLPHGARAAEGDPDAVGPAADVYALGVIAFELLGGRLPHEVAGLSITAAVRRVTEVEAPRLGTLDRALRGDVETIVAKALEPDPARRYVTPAALASDLRRYLAHEPIAARPAGTLYRARRFARRNPGLVGGTSAAILALATGLAFAWNFALDAKARRLEAERASYRNILISVAGGLDEPSTDVQRAQLAEAPEALRGWEWAYLHARTADPAQPVLDGATAPYFALETVDGAPLLAFALEAVDGAPRQVTSHGSIEVRDLASGMTVWRRDFEPRTTCHGLALSSGGDLTWIERGINTPFRARRVHVPDGEETLDRGLGDVGAEDDYLVLSADGHRMCDTRSVVDVDSGRPVLVGAPARDLDRHGELAVLQSHESAFTLVDLATKAELLRLPQAIGTFDSGSGRLVTLSDPFRLQVWDTTARPVREVFAGTVDTDPRCVSVASGDRAVAVVDRTGKLSEHVLTGPDAGTARELGRVSAETRPRWWPDGRHLALWSPAGIRTWDTQAQAGDVLTTHASFAYDVAPEPALGLVASTGWDGYVHEPGCLRLLDLESGAEVLRLGSDRELAVWLDWVPGSPKLVVDYRLMYEDRDKIEIDETRLLDLTRGQVAWSLRTDRVSQIACSPDGTSVALVTGYGVLRLLDAADGHERWSRAESQCTVCEGALAWDPRGQWIVVPERGYDEHRLVLLDPRSGAELGVIGGLLADVFDLDVSPNGRMLASACSDGTVHLWDAASRGALGAPLEHDNAVMCVAFHPGGSRLATGTRDGVIRIWNLDTHRELLQLTGHAAYVRSLVWTGAGRTLLSSSGDGTVRRWSARTALELAGARKDRDHLAASLQPRVDAFLAGDPCPRRSPPGSRPRRTRASARWPASSWRARGCRAEPARGGMPPPRPGPRPAGPWLSRLLRPGCLPHGREHEDRELAHRLVARGVGRGAGDHRRAAREEAARGRHADH